MKRLTDEQLLEAVALVNAHGSIREASRQSEIPFETLRMRYQRAKEAAARGEFGTNPVLPGFEITKTTAVTNADGEVVREFIQQKPAKDGQFAVPDGHEIKGVSALVDGNGKKVVQWIKTHDKRSPAEVVAGVLQGFKDELPRAAAVSANRDHTADLLVQYTITDIHLGMLAWCDETGDEDYDLKIAEQLLVDWFKVAIEMAPPTHTAILAQLGDLLHQDSHESVTPAHRHILDSDSRFQKIIRVALRVIRKVISMLLERHAVVHVVMADANHDPASEAWMREVFAMHYEDEPRVTVDTTAETYYVYEHGQTSLFYHHGHRRGVNNVDSVFVGRYREIYGRTKFSYAHVGHRHNDELKTTNLMKVEQHETLAAKDAYAAGGGWLSGRSAKVITYHKQFGEVGRITLTPDMVRSFTAANDNTSQEEIKDAG